MAIQANGLDMMVGDSPPSANVDLVLLISSFGGGGAERVASRLLNRLAEDGYSVVALSLSASSSDRYVMHQGVLRIGLDAYAESQGLWQALTNNIKRIRLIRQTLNTTDRVWRLVF